jgi:hypothetical protein
LSARRSALKTPAAELEAGAWLFCENALVVSVAIPRYRGFIRKDNMERFVADCNRNRLEKSPSFSASEWSRKKSPAISPGLGS